MESACGSTSKPAHKVLYTNRLVLIRKKRLVTRNNTPITVTNLDATAATVVSLPAQLLKVAVRSTTKATAKSAVARP